MLGSFIVFLSFISQGSKKVLKRAITMGDFVIIRKNHLKMLKAAWAKAAWAEAALA